jgi:hypothetical protein
MLVMCFDFKVLYLFRVNNLGKNLIVYFFSESYLSVVIFRDKNDHAEKLMAKTY